MDDRFTKRTMAQKNCREEKRELHEQHAGEVRGWPRSREQHAEVGSGQVAVDLETEWFRLHVARRHRSEGRSWLGDSAVQVAVGCL